jgi:hypothetical protein
MRACQTRHGQPCVFYGAAEFSRDIDLLVLTPRPLVDSHPTGRRWKQRSNATSKR